MTRKSAIFVSVFLAAALLMTHFTCQMHRPGVHEYSSPAMTAPATRSFPAPAGGLPVKLTILHVNDTHGRTQPWRDLTGFGGGYARLSTIVEEIRANKAPETVLLVDCGDILSRGDDLTTKTQGRANFEIMNRMGFDFWVPGNGDFYDGIDVLRRCIGLAKFPVLAANVRYRDSGEGIANEYAIRQVGPAKVAFLGLCFVREVLPSAWSLEVKDPIATARRLVPALRKQADLVVTLTHLGATEDVKLVQSVAGIDLVIGAHSHTPLFKPLSAKDPQGNEVPICQAGSYLQFLGKIEMELTPRDGRYRIAKFDSRLLALDQRVKLDPAITALIANLAEKATQPQSVPAATH